MKIIRYNNDIFPEFIFHNFNNSIFDANFSSELKDADAIPYIGFHKGQFWVPFFFNTYIYDMFFYIIECDIASYADDNTPYNFDFNLNNVISNLGKSTNSLLK